MATFYLSLVHSNHNVILLSILFSAIYSSSLVDCMVPEAESYHVVSVQSLIPKEECSSFPGTDPSKLNIVNRHGPCSPTKHSTEIAHEEILRADEARVRYLNTKHETRVADSEIPARTGTSLNTGNYVVQIALGTPGVPQSVVFDTGSDVTWVQCRPCRSGCYPQQDQLFDPSQSSTYSNISCSSQYCTSLSPHGCSPDSAACLYQVLYGDDSYTVGYYSQDTLTLGSDEIPNFRFGCGEYNDGLFGRTAGLLGLGRKPASVVSQTMGRYGGAFAYCLPALSSSVGRLTFGRGGARRPDAAYTPMLARPGAGSFYFVELASVGVGGEALNVDGAVFSTAGSIVDSGTVITRMPPTAYAELRAAFRRRMSAYPAAPEASILDTCYDLSGHDTVRVPVVAFNFRGATVRLDATGVLYAISRQQVCLGFAPNGNDNDLMIIGNTQQRTFDVVYDVANKLIGFGAGGC